jgi:arsenite-transporting ATPase
VSLRRQDGELVLAVGGHRRVVTLPAALQRCRVTDATVADGRLAVSFEPKEEVATHG